MVSSSYLSELTALGHVRRFARAQVKSMAKGRAELLSLISRRKYGEIFERDLAGRKLQRSLLDIRFHVRDLVGHGHADRIQTTAGVLLRAVKPG